MKEVENLLLDIINRILRNETEFSIDDNGGTLTYHADNNKGNWINIECDPDANGDYIKSYDINSIVIYVFDEEYKLFTSDILTHRDNKDPLDWQIPQSVKDKLETYYFENVCQRESAKVEFFNPREN